MVAKILCCRTCTHLINGRLCDVTDGELLVVEPEATNSQTHPDEIHKKVSVGPDTSKTFTRNQQKLHRQHVAL